MTGLDNILSRIADDAKKTADENIKGAEERIDEIKSEYAKEMAKVSEEEEKNRAEQIGLLKERSENEKRAYEREMLLSVQRDVAGKLIGSAKEKILEMPPKEYFEFLAEIYKNHMDFEGREILLSQEDKKNMPDDFLEKLGKNLTLSEENAPSRGFIVRNGRVELNCTISAIFRDMESRLYDIACRKE